MELPEYRWPDLGTVVSCAWERVRDYLEKAGTTIFLASLVLWFSFIWGHRELRGMYQKASRQSWDGAWLRSLSRSAWEPGRRQWRCLPDFRQKRWWYPASLFFTEPGTEVLEEAMRLLQPVLQPAALPEPAPWHFWYSVSFTHPCAAAMGAIKQETGSLRWTVGLAVYQLFLAWICAVLVYQAASRIPGLG